MTDATPPAAAVLRQVLAASIDLPVREALVVESLAYSMLLAGPDFAAWRAGRPRREIPVPVAPVLVERHGTDAREGGATLRVRLNVPERRNAFNRWVRNGVLEALELARLDEEIREVELTGAGPAFCAGGDLDEFGTATDVVAAHQVRVQASAGLAIHDLRDRVRPVLHGACVGAGIEVPAFAAHVRARRDAWFQLPEISMGLIPGAGGTVSIPRRIGVERTLEMALTGRRIDAPTALAWGLIDELSD